MKSLSVARLRASALGSDPRVLDAILVASRLLALRASNAVSASKDGEASEAASHLVDAAEGLLADLSSLLGSP